VPNAVSLALNRTATETRTALKRALQHQTGLPSAVVLKALKVRNANKFALSAAIVASGRHVPLADFKPRQTKAGVMASPWGRRQLFAHAFIGPTMGGHVFARKGRARLPIHELYGPAIPVEMVREASETVATFYATVPAVLAKRLDHELGRLMPAVQDLRK
jgi:hypothetical protein